MTTPKDIAIGLNNCFTQKIAKILDEMPPPEEDLLEILKNTKCDDIPEMVTMELSEHLLHKYIREMKKSAANGSDSINGKVLWDIFPSIQRTILHLINLSLCTGIFPSIFKTTKIAPVLKPGKDPLDPSNYRPVSNICIIGKLIEKAQFEQIKQHIRENKLINKNQHGGLSNHSTTTCLLELMNELNESNDTKMKTAVLAIDLSSAYDLVSHKVLLEKCRLLALGKETLNWLSNYLNNRHQYVDVNGETSTILPSGNYGVIQGAQSSGELFLIFLNNLPNANKENNTNQSLPVTKQFVDDLNSVVRAETNTALMTNILKEYKRLETSLINHRMKINREKTQLMYVKPDIKLRKMTLQIGETAIKHQSSIKILGVTIAEDLKFDEHIYRGKTNIIKSLNTKNALLRVIKPFINQKALSQIGNSSINSTILYAAPVWGRTTQNNLQKIQACQTRSARMIAGKRWHKGRKTHRQSVLNHLDWPNTYQLVSTASLNIVKKAITDNSSKGLNDLFKVSNPLRSRLIKGQTISHKGPHTRKNNHFSVYGTEEYNKLPVALRDKNITQKQFKEAIKSYSRTINLLQMFKITFLTTCLQFLFYLKQCWYCIKLLLIRYTNYSNYYTIGTFLCTDLFLRFSLSLYFV